ncbi:uncharacterized protein LOC128956782 [Oppia nitens]|uniref:uncharacterized protein LOC128956782 n=1 Tax=Oppia nitens TaxID=1686743 RepID=UPI0023DCC71D|nr:uncharacterized protein LOC128956782 [Oppia nitens]
MRASESLHSFGNYQCKKFSLLAWCILCLIVTIVVMVLAIKDAKSTWSKTDCGPGGCKHTEGHNESEERTMRIVAGVVGTIFICIELFGLFGAWKENYCCTMTYMCIKCVFIVIALLAGIFVHPVFWGSFAVNLFAAAIAFLYLQEISWQQQSNNRANYA